MSLYPTPKDEENQEMDAEGPIWRLTLFFLVFFITGIALVALL